MLITKNAQDVPNEHGKDNTDTSYKRSHFTFEQHLMLEWLWHETGKFKKWILIKPAILFGKDRLKWGILEHLTTELEQVTVYNADYA